MKLGAQAVLKTKGVLEAAVCYTGNFYFNSIFNSIMFFGLFREIKGISKHYDLDYYLNVADKMVNELKCHVLAVKVNIKQKRKYYFKIILFFFRIWLVY